MIRVNLIGNMGNQLFEYAYARALSEEFDDHDIEINNYFNQIYEVSVHGKEKIPNQLMNFQLNENVKNIGHLKGTVLSLVHFVPYAFDAFFHIDIKKEVYLKRTAKGKYRLCRLGYSYFEHNSTSSKNKVITGIFQSGKYFKNIRHILLNEFKVKNPPSDENKTLIEEVTSCNSVGVHIRRGDYLTPQFSFLNVCNEAYYRKAMKYVAEHTENPVFYIFSNNAKELGWIKDNYHFDYPVKYVMLNNPECEDFRVMYNCKHFIMSNSTLGWWASYMIENKEKIVVAPQIWQRKEYAGSMDIYRDDMVKIPLDLEDEK